jgi:putative transposase
MKYAFIEKNQQFYGVGAQCKILEISRSGYYAWQKRKKTDKKDHNQALIEHIRRISPTKPTNIWKPSGL